MKKLLQYGISFMTLFNISFATTVDMWDYMVNDHASSEYLTGSHDMRTYYIGSNSLGLIKDSQGYPFELFDKVGSGIYLVYENGGYLNEQSGLWVNDWASPNDFRYNFSGGFLWSPATISLDGNGEGSFERPAYWEFYQNHDTSPGEWKKAICGSTIQVKLLSFHDVGGDLGVLTDVVRLQTELWEGDHEEYFYDAEYGLVEWRYYENGFITGNSIFNYTASGTFSEKAKWFTEYGMEFSEIPGCDLGLPIALESYDGYYLVAENGGGSDLDADRTSVGIWETFYLIDLDYEYIESGDTIRLRTYNGPYYVTAEDGGGGAANADRSVPWIWEEIQIIRVLGPGQIRDGDKVYLKAYDNIHYFVAENGGGDTINADRDSAGPWEEFTIHFLW